MVAEQGFPDTGSDLESYLLACGILGYGLVDKRFCLPYGFWNITSDLGYSGTIYSFLTHYIDNCPDYHQFSVNKSSVCKSDK
jgi:hypothetical protein